MYIVVHERTQFPPQRTWTDYGSVERFELWRNTMRVEHKENWYRTVAENVSVGVAVNLCHVEFNSRISGKDER